MWRGGIFTIRRVIWPRFTASKYSPIQSICQLSINVVPGSMTGQAWRMNSGGSVPPVPGGPVGEAPLGQPGLDFSSSPASWLNSSSERSERSARLVLSTSRAPPWVTVRFSVGSPRLNRSTLRQYQPYEQRRLRQRPRPPGSTGGGWLCVTSVPQWPRVSRASSRCWPCSWPPRSQNIVVVLLRPRYPVKLRAHGLQALAGNSQLFS